MYNYKEWQNDKNERNLRSSYVWTRQQLMDIDPQKTDYALGISCYALGFFLSLSLSELGTLYGKIRYRK